MAGRHIEAVGGSGLGLGNRQPAGRRAGPVEGPARAGRARRRGRSAAARTGRVVLLRPPVEDLSDEELVRLVHDDDDRALHELLGRYRGLAHAKARTYFLVGADHEDIVQEGMIGLYKAIRDYDPTQQTSFRVFAELCTNRQILTAIKTATRQKHGPLNNYVSFHRPWGDDEDGERSLADVLATRAVCDPADLVISRERIRALQEHFDRALSDLEAAVLRLYVDGKSYQEIAQLLQRQVKSIDNALQRIKRKLDHHLRERELADAG